MLPQILVLFQLLGDYALGPAIYLHNYLSSQYIGMYDVCNAGFRPVGCSRKKPDLRWRLANYVLRM